MQESNFDLAILHLPPINLNNYRVWFPYSPFGADPETRYAPSGDAICNIRLATTDSSQLQHMGMPVDVPASSAKAGGRGMSHKLEPCSEYDSKNHKCHSGHVRLHPICRGIAHGCESCGKGNVPMCMLDDQPPHLIREDGMPLGWPGSVAPSAQKGIQ